MSLEATIAEVTARLRQGRFPNEQSISQGIVLRILNELGWDTWDTSIVWPEYQTGEGRADFALCHPPSKPALLIEVKPPGKAEDSVRQALDYAFHCGGVPFVVLTDGKTWSFYLTMEQGSYEERRVYKLDFFERNTDEAGSALRRYLERARIVSGEALECARSEYRSRNRRAQAQAAIPETWREIVEKGDELLVEFVADAVESKAGIRPDDNDVAAFLASLGQWIDRSPPQLAQRPQYATTPAPVQPSGTVTDFNAPSRTGILVLRDKRFPYANAKEAMVIALTNLAQQDASFLQRCSQHPDAQGRKRRYIAQTADELYPDRPDLREYHAKLPHGWLVATNLNNVLKKTIIRVASDVAGLRFGTDLRVDF